MSKKIKIVILSILMVISGIVAWHSLFTIFHLKLEDGPVNWVSIILSLIYPVLAFCAFLALVSISSILIQSKWILIIVFLVAALSVFLFFPFTPWIFIILLIQIVTFLLFSLRISLEAKERIKFSLLKTTKTGLGLTVTLIILSISLIYYITATLSQRDQGKQAIEGVVESTTSLINKILPAQVKGYDPKMTLDEFIFRQSLGAANQLGGKIGEEINNRMENSSEKNEPTSLLAQLQEEIKMGKIDLNALPPDLREAFSKDELKPEDLASLPEVRAIFQTQIDQSRDELLKRVGVEAKGDETISAVIAKIVQQYAFRFLGPFEKFITPLMALSVFFVLLIFNPLFRALIGLFALIIFQILLLLKFALIKVEKKEVQSVTL